MASDRCAEWLPFFSNRLEPFATSPSNCSRNAASPKYQPFLSTTMEKPKLQRLISQIDPTRHPLYVLLPTAEYQKHRAAWKLP